jgi:SAM-dependent methyltransferase
MTASETHESHELTVAKMPGHWLLAKMGKRVLRPGGLELTQRLLSELAVTAEDDVVEFAPGLGITARMTIARRPKSYIAVERDPTAAATVAAYLVGPDRRCIEGTAEATGLPNAAASVVYGEAMLSMQPAAAKARIVAEAARLLRPRGRYGIHELCLIPDDVDQHIRDAIQHDMSDDIHVGVRPLTAREWCELLEASGLTVTAKHFAPMHLLEPMRLVRDEGLLRAVQFVWNVARDSDARRRVLRMRRTFRKYRQHLVAITLVCTKS